TQRRCASVAGSGGHHGEQLGIHGDGGIGVESESLVGSVAHRQSGTLASASTRRKGESVADGVQNLHQCIHPHTLSNSSRGSTIDLSFGELELLATDVLPSVRTVALLRTAKEPESGCSGPPRHVRAIARKRGDDGENQASVR